MAENRSVAERIEHARKRLASDSDVWVATASADGLPHLVALSLAWDGTSIVVATPTDTLTVRNLLASGRARAALDSAVDVVMLDADATVMALDQVASTDISAYVTRVEWDPRSSGDDPWSLIKLTPTRVQVWNSEPEIASRTVMRNGVWIE